MKYLDAKRLHSHDSVLSKKDNQLLTVLSIEINTEYKTVKINCIDANNYLVTLYHIEIK